MYQCSVSFINDDKTALNVTLASNDQGLASGQYAVFYQGEACIGSGIIQTVGADQLPDAVPPTNGDVLKLEAC